MSKIFIIGFMGSGKSTLGRALARKLGEGCQFVDLDRHIEQREGASVSDIFGYCGEEYFRTAEAKYLRELIQEPGDCVIALGGGTPCFGDVMQLVLSSGVVVYLQHSVGKLVSRLLVSRTPRPLIRGKSEAELREYVSATLQSREEYYCRAHITIADPQRGELDEVLQCIEEYRRG